MSEDPYRMPPSKIFKDRGLCVLLEHVIGVVKFRSSCDSSIKVFLKTGEAIHMTWHGALDIASEVYNRLADAMETFHR